MDHGAHGRRRRRAILSEGESDALRTHAAKDAWGEASGAQRAKVLTAVADAIEAHAETLAVTESWENGKPVRETLAADIPLAADHFRYFAAAARAEESTISEIDKDLIAYHFHEPLGVVGQIIPFNFPLLMAAWKLAPALDHDDDFLSKAVEGLVLYAFNKGEVCTCPSRALIQESAYDKFMPLCLDRIARIRQGDPLDTWTMLGPQVSAQQLAKIGLLCGHRHG